MVLSTSPLYKVSPQCRYISSNLATGCTLGVPDMLDGA